MLIYRFFQFLCLTGLIAGSGSQLYAQDTITVGVTTGPHAQLIEVVKPIAAKDGLTIRVVEFSDFIQPNAALAAGELDANSFQHMPYLEAQIKDRRYQFVSVAKTVIFPMGLYSAKLKSLAKLKIGAKIAVPNDPTNGGRALLLLQKYGVITLRAGAGLSATLLDIKDNPKRLKIIELDAAHIPRVLKDVDAAAINTDFAVQAGLLPTRDALAVEAPDGPYANVIAVRAQDQNQPWVARLVKAYHSPEVKHYIERHFKGTAVPAW
jgi:D-methionine transport system substrate-binding protein